MNKISKYISFYSKGAIIFRENDKAEYIYYIKEGKISIFKNIGDTERVISIINQGEIFGELALLESSLRISNARAVEDTTIIKINEETAKKLMSMNSEFMLLVFKSILRRIAKISDMLEVAIINNNELKVVSLLCKFIKNISSDSIDIIFKIRDLLNYILLNMNISIDDAMAVLEKLDKLELILINSNNIIIKKLKPLKNYQIQLKKYFLIS